MSATKFSPSQQEEQASIALIYAENAHEVEPIREFLELYGCSVFINSRQTVIADYVIVCGKPDFVKGIYSSQKIEGKKSLIILWTVRNSEVESFGSLAQKIAVTDPPLFDGPIVKIIFRFFFTSEDKILNIKTTQMEEVFEEREEKPEQPYRDIPKEDITPKYFASSRATKDLIPDENLALNDDDKKRISETISHVFQKEITSKKNKHFSKKKNNGKPTIKILGSILLLSLMPSIWYMFSLLLSVTTIFFSAIQLSEGNIQTSKRFVTVSSYWTRQAKGTLSLAGLIFRLTNKSYVLRNQERVLSFLSDAGDAIASAQEVAIAGKEFSKTIASRLYGSQEESTSPIALVGTLKIQLPYIHEKLGLASAELASLIREGAFPFSLRWIHQKAVSSQHILDVARSNISIIEGLLSVYSAAGGFDEKKTYLLLLQNSMELRPTGGFIGSVAKVVMSEGIIESLDVQDVYAIDGQLKGHVDPPKPIQELLGQEHWYLRDSNWDPDFSASGQTAAWFYEKETGTKVDGVIAISSPFLTDLLTVTGPIDLSDYNDRITAENFFGKSLYYVQHDFFPGSTQKKDFLGSLTSAILTQVMQDSSINAVSLFGAIQSGLIRHDIQMVFIDQSLNREVTHQGWSGNSVTERVCKTSSVTTCIGDFVNIIEANLSVNKVNAFITRKRTTEVSVDTNGFATTTVSILYENVSDESTDGGGNYKNYLRFILPDRTDIIDVSIDGAHIPTRDEKEKKLPVGPFMENVEDITQQDGSQTKLLSVVMDVPPKHVHNIIVKYSHALAPIEKGQAVIYEFIQPKQPGISKTPLETRIRFPAEYVLVPQKDPTRRVSVANQTQLEYNSLLAQDEIVRVLITKP